MLYRVCVGCLQFVLNSELVSFVEFLSSCRRLVSKLSTAYKVVTRCWRHGGFHFYRVQKRFIYERTAGIGAIGAVRARGVHHMRTQCVGLHRGRTQHMSLSVRPT